MRAFELSYALNVNYTIPKLAKAGKQRGAAHAPHKLKSFFGFRRCSKKNKILFRDSTDDRFKQFFYQKMTITTLPTTTAKHHYQQH